MGFFVFFKKKNKVVFIFEKPVKTLLKKTNKTGGLFL